MFLLWCLGSRYYSLLWTAVAAVAAVAAADCGDAECGDDSGVHWIVLQHEQQQ